MTTVKSNWLLISENIVEELLMGNTRSGKRTAQKEYVVAISFDGEKDIRLPAESFLGNGK